MTSVLLFYPSLPTQTAGALHTQFIFSSIQIIILADKNIIYHRERCAAEETKNATVISKRNLFITFHFLYLLKEWALMKIAALAFSLVCKSFHASPKNIFN